MQGCPAGPQLATIRPPTWTAFKRFATAPTTDARLKDRWSGDGGRGHESGRPSSGEHGFRPLREVTDRVLLGGPSSSFAE